MTQAVYRLLYLHRRDSATVLHSVDGTLTGTMYLCVRKYLAQINTPHDTQAPSRHST